mgnify:CR=1 FL=1
MNSKEMVKLAYKALSDKKGEDIKIIDIQSVSVLADYFIIAHGSNPNQVQAMADNVEEIAKAGIKAIIQPGGSVRDDQVIETCDKYGMAMAFTGIRLFHH